MGGKHNLSMEHLQKKKIVGQSRKREEASVTVKAEDEEMEKECQI